ncbi:MAG: ATP-binding cassette domain-containing protein [Bacterioplanes sp.]|nr:ATP-binding cassette domain-containing protein [Bacterioplanes sp.]
MVGANVRWGWLSAYGYLAQQWDIFDLSLAANLRLAKADASDDELWQVLAEVGLHGWAKGLQQQLLTPLGEYGAGVSGGQARRIALARLLLKQQPILILDEPFAGVDAETVALMWQAIQTHQRHGILIVASHQRLPETVSRHVVLNMVAG